MVHFIHTYLCHLLFLALEDDLLFFFLSPRQETELVALFIHEWLSWVSSETQDELLAAAEGNFVWVSFSDVCCGLQL